MLSTRIKSFLQENNVKYNVIKHSLAYTAQEIAQSAHIKGRELTKSVIVKIDGKLAMVIEPANLKVDLNALQHLTGAKKVSLANENDFEDAFPECETGAMPPFGNLYGLEVYEDDRISLGDNERMVFNAGNHAELLEIKHKDFERLVKPQRVHLSA